MSSAEVKFQLRPDVKLSGWPGTMGGVVRRVHEKTVSPADAGAKVLTGGDNSLIKHISSTNQWSAKYSDWYNDILSRMGVLEDRISDESAEIPSSPDDCRDNDISLLPQNATRDPILRAFQATTKSDELTSKRAMANPSFDMTSGIGLRLSYKCTNCDRRDEKEVTVDELLTSATRDDSHCWFESVGCPNCKPENNRTKYLVISGTRAIVNWYKVVITLDNDLDRIRSFLSPSTEGDEPEGSFREVNGVKVFSGNIGVKEFSPEWVENLALELHKQYKYSMLGIILGVSDPGTPLELPANMKGFENPTEHWVKKRHVMTDLWWGKIKQLLVDAPECEKDCVICLRYRGEDWHDVAPHISHCDVYGRLHAGSDIYSMSWVERMMVTASYWDELGNKDPVEVSKAKCSIARACVDVALARDLDFDQRVAKQRCLLNLNTYTLRRCLNEARYRAATGLGAFQVGNFQHLEQMIRGRLFEGMTLPYVEDDMSRRSCTDCADMIVLAGQLGIVFHDAIDLPNDIFNGEYMNVYRMAASGGFDMLMKFTRGAHTLLKTMASVGAKDLCCKKVLQNALGNTVGWYFYCARYNYASNVQLVCNSEYTWGSLIDADAADWVGKLLGCNEKTLAKCREWAHLDLTSQAEWGCGNTHPVQRFQHMRNACFNAKSIDVDTAEIESAEVFCALAGAGRQHKAGVEGKCLCCEITWECVELSVIGDMVGRFVHHALQLGTGSIAMALDF